MEIPDGLERYLDAIGASPVVRERLEPYLAMAAEVLTAGGRRAGEVEDVFVSEYRDSNGARNYEGAWFFGGGLAMEARNFLTDREYALDCVRLSNGVARWEMTRQGFLRKEDAGAENSRLAILVSFNKGGDGLSGSLHASLKASGVNCKYFYDLFEKYIAPNI